MKRNRISEATGSGNAGHFKVPIVLSPQPWKENQVAPFTDSVYDYDNAELAYEEADGDFKETPEERARIEKRTDRIAQVDAYLKSFYTGQNDEDGSNLGDVENPEKIIQQAVGPLKEDLAVWFGTKKKPKGSKQPKGPWVNICRKKEGGGHPPCGRPDADPKGYPKCRAAGVASKMSDSEKRAACSQKRRAEKKDPKVGKGNKPTMVSYKPKNESMKKTIRLTENELINVVRKVLSEQIQEQGKKNGIFKKRAESIDVICNGKNEADLAPLLYKEMCRRPKIDGSRPNVTEVKFLCDTVGFPTIIANGLSEGPRTISYNCQTKEIDHGLESIDYYLSNEEKIKQGELDKKWLSQFCQVIKNSKNIFKSCSSKVS